jgi:hypothetical protein
MACFSRFQRSVNPNLIKSKWKAEEDAKLADLVTKHGEKNWQQGRGQHDRLPACPSSRSELLIASARLAYPCCLCCAVARGMKMRTDQQCMLRWQRSVNPAIRSGRWMAAEDMRLKLAVRAYGAKNWTKLRHHVPGRTDAKCRERWVNVLDPGLSKDKWSAAEDAKLLELARLHGAGQWTKIARQLQPRTDNQCWRRWKRLTEKTPSQDAYRKDLENKRKVRGALQTAAAGRLLSARPN